MSTVGEYFNSQGNINFFASEKSARTVSPWKILTAGCHLASDLLKADLLACDHLKRTAIVRG